MTIENTREGSSLNNEFVTLSFVEFKARLIALRFALLLCHYPRYFTVAFQAAISHGIYSNVNLKVKQVICLEAIYHGRDVVAVLPTGYGKSVTFHLLPSLFLDKITYERGAAAHPVVIVFSPLNALIKDQIRRLQEGNVKAALLNVKKKTNSEDLESDLSDASLLQLRVAKYEVIFTHPEAFLTCKQGIELFQTAKYQTNVHAIVSDEAHCILI